ncbi:MAG: hypothetical protein ACYC1M_16410 [Armatimonadota bacterium]
MAENIVISKPARHIRWWPLLSALGVLWANAWISQRSVPLDGVFRHCAAPSVKVDCDELPFAVSALAKIDPRWQQVKLMPDLGPTVPQDETGERRLTGVAGQCQRARRIIDLPPKLRTAKLLTGMMQEPANAFYPLLMAHDLFKAAKIGTPAARNSWQYTTVEQPQKMLEALQYVRIAMHCPVYTDHGMAYCKIRLEPVAAIEMNLTEYVVAESEVTEAMHTSGLPELRLVTRSLGMSMSYLASIGQKQQAMELAISWQPVYLYWLTHALTYVEASVFQNCIGVLIGATAHTAEICGVQQMADEYTQLGIEWKAAHGAYLNQIESPVMSNSRGFLSNRYNISATGLPASDLEPSRTAEQAFLERLISQKLCLLAGGLLVWVLVWCAFGTQPMGKADIKRVWTACIWTLVPWVIYAILSMKPEWMGRQYGIGVLRHTFALSLVLPCLLSLIIPAIGLMTQPKWAPLLKHWVTAGIAWAYSMIVVFGLMYMMYSPMTAIDWLACLLALGLAIVSTLMGRWLTDLASFRQGMIASMLVLWMAITFVAYPLFTVKEQAAWSRDKIIVNRAGGVSPLERKAITEMVTFHMQVAQAHRLRAEITQQVPDGSAIPGGL